jgi:hypothetical protein
MCCFTVPLLLWLLVEAVDSWSELIWDWDLENILLGSPPKNMLQGATYLKKPLAR